MTSYEDQLAHLGEELDAKAAEQERKEKRNRSLSTKSEPVPIRSSPSVRVVGFNVDQPPVAGGRKSPIASPASSPISASPRAAVLSGSSPSPSDFDVFGFDQKRRAASGGSPTKKKAQLRQSRDGEDAGRDRGGTTDLVAAQLSTSFEKKASPLTAMLTRQGSNTAVNATANTATASTASTTTQTPQTQTQTNTTATPITTPTAAKEAKPAPARSSGAAAGTQTAGGAATEGKKEKKPQPPPAGRGQKAPTSRAERRAIQEEQRAAKAAKLAGKKAGASGAGAATASAAEPAHKTVDFAADKGRKSSLSGGPSNAAATAPISGETRDSQRAILAVRTSGKNAAVASPQEDPKQLPLFSHLPQLRRKSSAFLGVGFTPTEKIHPSIVQLGLKYANGVITGSNARCVAMLTAFKDVIRDYVTPEGQSIHRTLDMHLRPHIQYLTDCRPHSISMGNAIKYVKKEIPHTQEMTEEEAKEYLIKCIDHFIKERIVWADKEIASFGVTKINDGDVILTYASSHPVQSTLEAAFQAGKKFRVIIVDSEPKREGKELLRRLMQMGLKCSYILINAVSYVMKEVTKVFVGAYTLLANGNVMSRSGTAVVAMVANAYHVPVIVCCETYKFCERVQIDSIVFNEVGDPDELAASAPAFDSSGNHERHTDLKDWRKVDNMKVLNLVYDVTPATFVTMVVTEVGMIPPTSVPVVLREYSESV